MKLILTGMHLLLMQTTTRLNKSCMKMMKAACFEEHKDDMSNVVVKDVAKPAEIPSDCVVVKLKASSINPVDLVVINGAVGGFGWATPLPMTMGYDISGVIDSVGSEVTSFAAGDEVFGVNWGSGNHDTEPVVGGAMAEYVLVKASKLSKKPSELSFEETAAVSLVGTTAYQALGKIGVHDGSTKKVLILGGSGAVGSLAIQIAKAAGCWVATTCSSRTKAYVESFGAADLIIDYTKDKWEEMDEIKGIDAVFDAVGEKEALERAKPVLGEGKFVTIVSHQYGFDPTAYPPLKFASSYILSNDAEVQDKLASMLVDKTLKINVEKKFPFSADGIKDLMASQKSGKNMGKSVVVMED